MEERYLLIDGVIICDIPDRDVLNWNEINQISTHTINTWQEDRDSNETLNNTVQGKVAEYVLEKFFEDNTSIRYLSYDKFRRDDYKKHAPFDGLIYEASVLVNLDYYLQEIVKDVGNNDAGQISENTRKLLEDSKIFTVEIKSSQLRKKDYQNVNNVCLPRTQSDYETIIKNIRKWDYFVYPFYLRKSETITSFYDYAETVRNKLNCNEMRNAEFLKQLMLKEYNNDCDIYTRLYFDYKANQVFIPGYMIKANFYKNPYIGKMPGEKSGMALYYMRSISEGASFIEIENDSNIWNYDRLRAYASMFACSEKKCPSCGDILKICNIKSKKNYCYRCFDCDKWYSMNQINEREGEE